MNYRHITVVIGCLLSSLCTGLYAQKVDYSVVSVPEEAGIDFTPITTPGDYVYMPPVRRLFGQLEWFTNRVIQVSPDGLRMAYLSERNKLTNIFIKELNKQGGSIQRTNRTRVLDFSYSPDGHHICFSENRGKTQQVFLTSAHSGYVCRQITSGNQDYSPVYSDDMRNIFFARLENKSASIWSYNCTDNFLSSYTAGFNPCPLQGQTAFLCTRTNGEGRSEIWKINYENGVEECIISDRERSFTSPTLSPDGQWILFTGSSKVPAGKSSYWNTDIFACKLDGTGFTQLTYHAADDLSPVWSKDGKHIYFISQRGSAEGIANIWRMNFNY